MDFLISIFTPLFVTGSQNFNLLVICRFYAPINQLSSLLHQATLAKLSTEKSKSASDLSSLKMRPTRFNDWSLAFNLDSNPCQDQYAFPVAESPEQ